MREPYDDRLHQIRGLLRTGDEEAARQQAEAAVAECEAKGLQSLAEVFRGALCYIDDDYPGTIAHLSKAFEDSELGPTGDFWHMWGYTCLLYTSDAADDLRCVDLGGRRSIKKKKNTSTNVVRNRSIA